MTKEELDLVRRLRDVGSSKIDHLYKGNCPDSIGGSRFRAKDCPACKVLIEADQLLKKANATK